MKETFGLYVSYKICQYSQTDGYFMDREKAIIDLFAIEMKKIYVHVCTRLFFF